MPSTKILTINYYDALKVLKFNNHIVGKINNHNISSFNNNLVMSGVSDPQNKFWFKIDNGLMVYTITGIDYGMTWRECATTYGATNNISIAGNTVKHSNKSVQGVLPDDKIIPYHTYSTGASVKRYYEIAVNSEPPEGLNHINLSSNRYYIDDGDGSITVQAEDIFSENGVDYYFNTWMYEGHTPINLDGDVQSSTWTFRPTSDLDITAIYNYEEDYLDIL